MQFAAVRLRNPTLSTPHLTRAELALRAEQRLAKGKPIFQCNIGNPHQLKQKPISFFRGVLSLLEYPDLIPHLVSLQQSNPSDPLLQLYPSDVVSRAKAYVDAIPGGMGAYSNSQGTPLVRQEVADFIAKRDGYPSSPDQIFLCSGASEGVHTILKTMIRGPLDAILTPIPQYPLYSACLDLYNGTLLPYELFETDGWSIDLKALEETVQTATANGKSVRAITVINPGNPTGQCLSVENMQEIVRFCHKHSLVLLADEVYQENCYTGPFTSFKKVLSSMPDLATQVQLISFHSISKGFIGECGHRGGYYEVVNVASEVVQELVKLVSINLCTNLPGQVLVGMMVNPPAEGDPSFALYEAESKGIYNSLKKRSETLVSFLNTLENVTCNTSQGAMYAFPRIRFSEKAMQAAANAGKPVDTFYCLELLEATGICVVPGSGFGQEDGTWHFRTTFLPSEQDIDHVMELMRTFHEDFCDRYR